MDILRKRLIRQRLIHDTAHIHRLCIQVQFTYSVQGGGDDLHPMLGNCRQPFQLLHALWGTIERLGLICQDLDAKHQVLFGMKHIL